MKVSSKINFIRRKLTRFLTSNIGKSSNEKIDAGKFNNRNFKVLIVRPNHRLGNLLLLTPVVKELEDIFTNPSIDLFVKGNLSEIIFKNYDSINKHIKLPKKPFNNLFYYFLIWTKLLFKKYDLVLNIDEFSSSGRLASSLVNSKYKIIGNDKKWSEKSDSHSEILNHMAIKPIVLIRSFLTNVSFQDEKFYSLDLKLDEKEIENGNRELIRIFKNNKKTISIFTYATGNKMLSKEWWDTYYNYLKSNFSNYNIIEILPIENVSQIDFKTKTYYSKNIREIASIIANTDIFIGADSGIMHLSASSNTTTIGLFSGDFKYKYEPYGEKNIGIDKNKFSQNDIIIEMKKKLES